MGLTAEQLEARRAYLGGTDAAALAGVNPPRWSQPIDVYHEKVGTAPPRAKSKMMAMGNLMEELVAGLFTEATGIGVRRPARPVRSRAYPWAGGHLDRWTSDGLFLECKWAERRDEWGESMPIGTPEAPTIITGEERPQVPARYMVQVQHYMAVTARPSAYLAVLLGYGDFRWYVIHRDEVLVGKLMQLEEEFWTKHVLAGVPPEPDGSSGYSRHLRELYATDEGTEAVATPEQAALAEQLRQAKAATASAELAEAEVTQRLQLSMGTTAKLVGDGFAITWRQTRPVLEVQWEELATELLGMARVPLDLVTAAGDGPWGERTKKERAEQVRAVAQAMGLAREKPGRRPFLPTFTSDEEQ